MGWVVLTLAAIAFSWLDMEEVIEAVLLIIVFIIVTLPR